MLRVYGRSGLGMFKLRNKTAFLVRLTAAETLCIIYTLLTDELKCLGFVVKRMRLDLKMYAEVNGTNFVALKQ